MLTQAHTSYAFKHTDTTPTAQIKSRLMEDLVCPGTPDNLREAADSVFESLAVRRRMQGDAHFKVYNASHEETMDVDRFWVLSGQVCLTIRVQRVVSCVQRVANTALAAVHESCAVRSCWTTFRRGPCTSSWGRVVCGYRAWLQKQTKKTATCAIGSAIAFAAMRDLSSSLTGILAAMSRCPTQIT